MKSQTESAFHRFRGKLAVVTPTRNRAYSLSLTQKYLERQTVKPDLWIVASEGNKPDIDTLVPMVNIHGEMSNKPGKNSLCRNMMRAIAIAKDNSIDGILMMEDDDWYRADYLGISSELLNKGDVTGIFPVQYLHLTNGNVSLSNAMPFSQMGFSKNVFQDVIDIANRGAALIDQELQQLHKDNRCCYRARDLYSLSIKGMYGALGVTRYHKSESAFGQKSTDIYETLKSFIGENDALAYKAVIDTGECPY